MTINNTNVQHGAVKHMEETQHATIHNIHKIQCIE